MLVMWVMIKAEVTETAEFSEDLFLHRLKKIQVVEKDKNKPIFL